jgi:Fe-S-cluster containining protein
MDTYASEPIDGELVTEERLAKLLDERFDEEAVAQIVEHLDFSNNLSKKLTVVFRELRSSTSRNSSMIQSVQAEIRDLILDVALLKRALTSLGHVGVMERRRIEKELVRELFPPSQPRQGTGLVISYPNRQPVKKVDCENRLHLCKAACCRIFNVGLSPEEVQSDRYDWNPRQPYALHTNRQGCVHLAAGSCACAIYDKRPGVCQTYSCEKDQRIWADFENKIINPELKKRLDTLEVNTSAPFAGSRPAGSSNGHALASTNYVLSTASNGLDVRRGAKACSIDRSHPDLGQMANSERPLEPPDPKPTVTAPQKKVDPPNFDDLRELMIPLPEKKFVPSSKPASKKDA